MIKRFNNFINENQYEFDHLHIADDIIKSADSIINDKLPSDTRENPAYASQLSEIYSDLSHVFTERANYFKEYKKDNAL